MTHNRKKNLSTPASKAGKKILSAMQEALDGAVTTYYVTRPIPEVDVRHIREQLGMNRNEFAHAFHLSPYSLRNWELGARAPNSTVHAFLYLIQSDPLRAFTTLNG